MEIIWEDRVARFFWSEVVPKFGLYCALAVPKIRLVTGLKNRPADDIGIGARAAPIYIPTAQSFLAGQSLSLGWAGHSNKRIPRR